MVPPLDTTRHPIPQLQPPLSLLCLANCLSCHSSSSMKKISRESFSRNVALWAISLELESDTALRGPLRVPRPALGLLLRQLVEHHPPVVHLGWAMKTGRRMGKRRRRTLMVRVRERVFGFHWVTTCSRWRRRQGERDKTRRGGSRRRRIVLLLLF